MVGATGWIGSAVCRAGLARGREVVGVGRAARRRDPGFVALDALDDLLAERACTVVNAAGAATGDPAHLAAANVTLAAQVADACERAGAPLLSLGSAAEYGPPTADRVAETHPEAPVSDYGRSKLAATRDLRARREAGAATTVARVFNLLGPGRPGTDPVQEFAAAVRALPPEGGEVRPWDSSLVRDYSSLAWTADRLVDLADHAGREAVVNVCSGRGLSFRELIEAMAVVRGVAVTIVDTRPGGLPRVVGDPSLLHALVGPAPVEDVLELARIALDAQGPRP